ncbi:MAG: hypothetical protein CSA35_00855 [Dethiosulfovibrio peptidovorans]|nr:MAG: hypothetical protein CSA35_00855 [Dethiosulfovibrio peptidovorans]
MIFVTTVFRESLDMFLDTAPYMLFGVAISGLIKAFIEPEWVQRFMGGRGFAPVARASLVGIPLPLCSCGVIPAAVALKKQGASANAVTAFLISTPESGVDSIAMSYALLDPIMTVARPIVAFMSATVAGILAVFFGGAETTEEALIHPFECGHDHHHHHEHHNDNEHTSNRHALLQRLRNGLDFAVFDVWGDLAKTFFVGVIFSGLIAATVPEHFLETALGGGLGSMVLMSLVGIPIYICATASTPLAAALIMKGVSPGAALVFLLAGPATNVSALPMLYKVLGSRRMLIYLSSIFAVSILSGLALDALYITLGLSAQSTIGKNTEALPPWVQWATATALLIFWAMAIAKRYREDKELDPRNEKADILSKKNTF